MLAYAPQRRLYLSLAASVSLHAALLGSINPAAWRVPEPVKALAPVLQAHLLSTPDAADLLKNTLNDAHEEVLAQRPPPAIRPSAKSTRPMPRRKSAERKLAEHVFYPSEAVASGLQGEVWLLLTLDAEGRLIDIRIASSSGHDLLDRAAIAAAQAMGRLPDTGVRELILPVVFKLQ